MNFKNLIVISVLALAGCGGGGGTSAINSGAVYATDAGSAAIGAAMSNAAISIQPLPSGSNAEITLTANASGTFTIPAGTKFPALVKATSLNKQYTYYGYIKSADQVGIPINPITTTLLTLAAGGHPSTITTALSDSALSTARTNTAALFSALLAATGQSNVTDFLSKTFSTDHTGLDLILDSIGIQLSNSGVISVINKMTGAVTVVDPQSIVAIAFDSNAISQMNSLPIGLCASFLDGLNGEILINNTSVYDASFLNNGYNRAAFATWLADAGGAVLDVNMPVFTGLDGNANLTFNVSLQNPNTGKLISDYHLVVKKDLNQNCVLVGNQFPFEMSIQPAIKNLIRVDSSTDNTFNKYAGLEIYIGGTYSPYVPNDIGGVRVMSARIDVCSAQGVCSMLATLTNTSGAAFGKFTIDNIDANNGLGMIPNSGVNLFTDTSTPIKITFFGSLSAPLTGSSNSIGVYYTRSSGSEFTSEEVAAATMPSVNNSGVITSSLNNPQLQWNSGSGVLSSIYVGSNDSSTYTNAQSLILSEGSGFTTLQITDTGSAIYRSIDMSSHIPNRPGMLETKYIWAPTCPSCY